MLDEEINNQKNEVDFAPSVPTNTTDITSLVNDVMSFKSKQNNLEKAMMMLIKQHETLIKENKMLWDEIRKSVEADENKSNQLIMVLAFYLSNFNSSAHPAS